MKKYFLILTLFICAAAFSQSSRFGLRSSPFVAALLKPVASAPSFSPSDIPGMMLWWDSRDQTVNNNTADWFDRIQNAKMAVKSGTPTNALKGVWFSSACMTNDPKFTFVWGGTNFSFFCVTYQETQPAGYQAIWTEGGPGNAFYISSKKLVFFSSGDRIFSDVLGDNTKTYWTFITTNDVAPDFGAFTNGVFSAGITTALPVSNTLDSMGDDNFSSFFKGWIGALMVWSNVQLTADNILNLSNYAVANWP